MIGVEVCVQRAPAPFASVTGHKAQRTALLCVESPH
jgi:hypothetical protein